MRTTKAFRELGILKATTVHQEFRVLRRTLNVAVRKKFLWANPCLGVEVGVSILRLFRPHYVTWPEQQLIEFHAPENLRNVVRIITERINLDEERSIGGRTIQSWCSELGFDTVLIRFCGEGTAKAMQRQSINFFGISRSYGRRGWTRTSDPLLRRQVLYPPELRARFCGLLYFNMAVEHSQAIVPQFLQANGRRRSA